MAGQPDPFADLDTSQAPRTDPFSHLDSGSGAQTTASGIAGSIERGIAPIATGAAAGAAAAGIPTLGVGAIPGAIAGAGAVGLTELATGVYNKLAPHMGWPQIATPQDMTDKVLDVFGVKRPSTGTERVAENTAAGAAGALGGAGAARTVADLATGPVTKGVAESLAQRPVAQAASGALSGAGTQAAAEAGLGPTAQTVAGLVAGALPYGKEGVLATVKANARPEAKEAIKNGFVFSPVEIPPLGEKPGGGARLFSGEGGKIKFQQDASVNNQTKVNGFAARAIGLHPNTHLNDQAFTQAEAPAAAVYREVEKAVPEVELARDPEYQEDAANIGGKKSLVERFFPDMADKPSIAALRDSMTANGSIPTEVALRKVADLRMQASNNFRVVGDAEKHALALAQKQAADVLEAATERAVKNAPEYYRRMRNDAIARRDSAEEEINFWSKPRGKEYEAAFRTTGGIPAIQARLDAAKADVENWQNRLETANSTNQDNQTLLDRFRDARRLFAKIYTVRDATNRTTGEVSAAGLARVYNKGAPFTDELKIIADAYNTAPKDMQLPSRFGRSEDWSALDFFGTSAAVLHGNPAVAAGILARPFIRRGLLSPTYQGAVAGLPSQSGRIGVLPLLTGPVAGSIQGATQGMP
jgi:hypothetical protein